MKAETEAPAPSKPKVVVKLGDYAQNWSNLADTIPKRLSKKKYLEQKAAESSSKKVKLTNPAATNGEEEPSEKIWFDVDKIFLPELNKEKKQAAAPKAEELKSTNGVKVKSAPSAKITRAVAIDCEMVGVGEDGRDSILARVSLVNQYCECIYDKYVLPTEPVTDFRTTVSGIRPQDLKKENGAISFKTAQAEVSEIIKNKVLVGHAIHNDLKVLFLDHPKKKVRDTQKCKVFRRKIPSIGSLSSLRNLAKLLLGIEIQSGEHDSVQDAQVTMRLYTMFKKEWEAEIRDRRLKRKETKAQTTTMVDEAGAEDQDDKLDKADAENLTKKILPANGENGQKKPVGNDNHKRYLKNKLKRRNSKNFLNKKSS